MWRTALFIGRLHSSPQLRIIGVDGRVGPKVRDALSALCAAGYLEGGACGAAKVTWEAEDSGRGWFRFHHHHLHISVLPRRSAADGPQPLLAEPDAACLAPTCE